MGLLWYIIVLVLPYVIQFVSFGISALIDRSASLGGNLQPWYMIFLYFPLMIAEEWGWRGIALPELEKRYNAVVSTFVLGAVWSLWHLPLFFIPGVAQYEMSLITFALSVMAMSFILTWIYNSTQSVLLCVFYRAMSNAAEAMGFNNWLDRTITADIGL